VTDSSLLIRSHSAAQPRRPRRQRSRPPV